MDFIKWIDRVLIRLEKVFSGVAVIMLFLTMMIVVVDVGLRYFFNAPFSWSYDLISMYLMVGLFFLSLSPTLANNGHICIDLLHKYMPPAMMHATEMIGYVLASGVFAGIVFVSVISTYESYQAKEVVSGVIVWPIWLSKIAVPIGAGTFALRMMLRIVGHALSLLMRRSIIELPPVSGTKEST